GRPRTNRPNRPVARASKFRPRLEALEDRTMPSSYTAGSVAELIADINAANAAGGANTISLNAGTTFSLTVVDNTTYGPTGLPVIANGDNLTIIGNGDTIARSTASGTPDFRAFAVAGGATLTLTNLSVSSGGQISLAGGPAQGGAIYNLGTLTLSNAT